MRVTDADLTTLPTLSKQHLVTEEASGYLQKMIKGWFVYLLKDLPDDADDFRVKETAEELLLAMESIETFMRMIRAVPGRDPSMPRPGE